MKTKMCEYYGTKQHPQSIVNGKCNMVPGAWCPKGTTSLCELLPPKPRKKMVAFKAWTTKGLDGKPYGISHTNPKTSNMYYPEQWFPCTITIEAKYMKGEK